MGDCLYCKTLDKCSNHEDCNKKILFFKVNRNNEGYFLSPSDKFKADERIKKRFTILRRAKKYLEKYAQKYPKCFLYIDDNLKTIEITYNQISALLIKKIYTDTEISLLSHILHSELFFRILSDDYFSYLNNISSNPFVYEMLSYENPSATLSTICNNMHIEVNSHENTISGLALSKDKNYLFTTGDCCIVMWDLNKRHQVHIFEYTCSPKPIIISHKNNFVISGSRDDNTKIWDINAKSLVSELEKSHPLCLALIDADDILIEGNSYGKIVFWCLKTFSFLKQISMSMAQIFCLALSSDNKNLYTGPFNGQIRRFNLKTEQKVEVEDLKYRVLCISITKNNNIILSGTAGGFISIFDIKTKTRCGLLTGHIGSVFDVKLIDDDKRVISCGMDNTVRIWDIVNKCQIAELISHKERVNKLVVSDDEKMCFSGGVDCKICAWNLDEMRLEYEKMCFGIATRGWLGRDNKFLFCYHDFSGLSVWDLKKNDYVIFYKGNFKPFSVKETNDKKLVVIGCQRGFYFVYKFINKRTGKSVWDIGMEKT